MRKKELIKKVELLEEKVNKHETTIKNIVEIILDKQAQDAIQQTICEINELFKGMFRQPRPKQKIKKQAKEEVKPQPKRTRGRPRKVIKGEQ